MPRQPSRLRLAGAGDPSRACAAAMASTTEDGGEATSQTSFRASAGSPPAGSLRFTRRGNPRERLLELLTRQVAQSRGGVPPYTRWSGPRVAPPSPWQPRVAAPGPAHGCIVVGKECVVTQTGLTVAKWPGLRLPRPGHKAKRAPSRWFGAAGAGGHPELGRVPGGTRGGTRPEALRFCRNFQVRQTNRQRTTPCQAANWLLPGLPPPHAHEQGKLRSRKVAQ